MSGFTPLRIETGVLLDLGPHGCTALVRGWDHASLTLDAELTHYGMVTHGSVTVKRERSGEFCVHAGMYFVIPGVAALRGTHSAGLVISHAGPAGLFQIGGPVERKGRLRYLDGCSDTLLVSPPKRGDACLNHLHIPAGVCQTAHTHPSARVGVVLSGSGECRTEAGIQPLEAGMGWYIPAGCLHSFLTGRHAVDVIAWHPDSDFGPTDEDHPMINRTDIRRPP